MRNLLLIWVLLLGATAVSFGVCEEGTLPNGRSKEQTTEQRETTEAWLTLHYLSVVNKILPIDSLPADRFAEHVQWTVTVRILPPHEEREYLFSLQKLYGGEVKARAVTPKGSSIVSQVRTLLQKHPHDTWEQLSMRVCLLEWRSSRADNQRLSRFAREFEDMRISPALPDELRVHQTAYEIFVQSGWGSQLTVRMEGPGAGARRQPHPLLRWIETFRQFLEDRGRDREAG